MGRASFSGPYPYGKLGRDVLRITAEAKDVPLRSAKMVKQHPPRLPLAMPAVRQRRFGLARALSKLGYCSRSQAASLIRRGRVRLNGKIRRDPETPTNPERDIFEVDGKLVAQSEKIYLIVNKPPGFVTTASDEKGRKTVYDLLDKILPWLGPVGRLDQASEGLLLFTNDPEWSAALLAPASHVTKTYHVQIQGMIHDSQISSLTRGVNTDAGEMKVLRAEVLRRGSRNTWLEITLDEGKNRQIRRMMNTLGFEVLRLIRVSIGPVVLGTLAKGTSRSLTKDEKAQLDRAMRERSDKEI
jgi:23S rRNA pseudouridine2605 synthase